MKELKVSIIIPVRNEEKYIQKCINSIKNQDFDSSNMEVIFVDGLSEDKTVEIIQQSIQNNTMFKILRNPQKTTPCALNIGIKNAKGKYIIRMDAHSEYPNNYVSKCIYYIENIEADNVGCLVETKAEGSTGKAIADVLSSQFGVGNSKFRTNAKSGYVDTVPFGTFRRELFKKIGYFDERLERNQDSEFNNRIISNGGKIYLFNDIKIVYHPRDSIKSLIRMALLNGKWNIITNYLVSGAMRLRHFIPLMFVISIILGIIACLFKIKFLIWVFIGELILYLLCDLLFSIKSIKKGIKHSILKFVIYPIFHISYGIGSIKGIFGIKKVIKGEEKMKIEEIKNKKVVIGVVGLGYVGLPLAVSFAKKFKVIGFDINKQKVEKYMAGVDVTGEVGDKELSKSTIEFTCDEQEIKKADFIIVAVPTPIDGHKKPDLTPVVESSKIVGRNIKKGAIVIYESTVYPGLTEEVCVPILEEKSGLKCGQDFKVAYSPERINPGDKEHRFETITKIVSGMDEETLELVAQLYESVLKNGVYKASSIKVAEAAKVIENSQRDINIAFVNELAVIFNRMGIDTNEVLDAAGSKWNFLNFRPGLVGGHCIGVDPFYLTYKSEEMGHLSELILASRRVNDGMGKFIAESIVKTLIRSGKTVKGSKILILGLTFKENVPDLRNSKVMDIVKELEEYEIKVYGRDPYANLEEIKREYGLTIDTNKENEKVDGVVFAVAHNEYKGMSIEDIKSLLKEDSNLVFDIKQIVDKKMMKENGIELWRL